MSAYYDATCMYMVVHACACVYICKNVSVFIRAKSSRETIGDNSVFSDI